MSRHLGSDRDVVAQPPRLEDPLAFARNMVLGSVIFLIVLALTWNWIVSAIDLGGDRLVEALVFLLFLSFWTILPGPCCWCSPTGGPTPSTSERSRLTTRPGTSVATSRGAWVSDSGSRASARPAGRPAFLRYLTLFAFCYRYSTFRYMSLEAGLDWLPRLWRSRATPAAHSST